ncbi:MAG: aminotransferase class V-fold PLP-dependent enzyme [Ilumatobacter sp.]
MNTSSTDRAHAEALDAADPLAQWRDEFVISDPSLVYLDGNSLGMTPKRTVEAVRNVVETQWSSDLIASWWTHDWLNLPLTVGNEVAPLIGARPGEVVVNESTTVCLFQLVNVALDLREASVATRTQQVIAVEDTEFPTDRYVVDGIAQLRPDVRVQSGLEDLAGVDVVVRSLVDYRTAELHDMKAETQRARAAGAVTVWDLSHAVGVVPVDLTGAGAELAAGCTYKFLNGGPGAPAFSYVRTELHDRLRQPIQGWFAQQDQFAMDEPFSARPGIAAMMNGTPSVIGLTAARAGISLSAQASITAISTKAQTLTHYALDLADALGLTTSTARPPASSGGHVSVTHPDATNLQQQLADRSVIVDKRDPDVLRLGLSPLTTRFVDVHTALMTLHELTV